MKDNWPLPARNGVLVSASAGSCAASLRLRKAAANFIEETHHKYDAVVAGLVNGHQDCEPLPVRRLADYAVSQAVRPGIAL